MPKIPLSERKVQQATPTVQVPSFDSRGTQGAQAGYQSELDRHYGAIQNYGHAVNKLEMMVVDRLQEHYQMEDEKEATRLDTSFRMEALNLLESKEIDDKGIPKGVMNRELGNANGITLEYIGNFNSLKNEYLKKAANGDQAALLNKSFQNQFQSTYDRVYKHEAKQFNDSYIENVNTNLKQRVLDAGGVTNPEALNTSMAQGASISELKDKRLGLSAASIKYNKELISYEIAKNSINGIVSNDVKAAQKMFDSVKGQLAPQHQKDIQDTIYGKGLEEKANFTFVALRNKRFANGDYNFKAMQEAIYADNSTPPDQKERLWNTVKSKANEDMQQTNARKSANDESFLNEITQSKFNGNDQDATMKIIGKYGGSAYDKYQRQNIIRRLYTAEIPSNPTVRMNLWTGVQNNQVSKEEIDQALNEDQISVSEHARLSQDLYKSKTLGTSAADKNNAESIKLLAKKSFSDAKKRDQYEWEVNQQTRGMSNSEAMATAKKMLENDPNTGFLIFGKKKQWESSAKQRDKEATDWGNIYLNVGKDQVKAIGQGYLKKGADWGVPEVDQFAKHYGGYPNIKVGTPINDIIEALRSSGRPVTIETVDKVIIQNPRLMNRSK